MTGRHYLNSTLSVWNKHFQGRSYTDFYQSLEFRKCNSSIIECPLYASASCFNFQELIIDRKVLNSVSSLIWFLIFWFYWQDFAWINTDSNKEPVKKVQTSGCNIFEAEYGCEYSSDVEQNSLNYIAKNVQTSGCSFFRAESGCGKSSDGTKNKKACKFACQERIFNLELRALTA